MGSGSRSFEGKRNCSPWIYLIVSIVCAGALLSDRSFDLLEPSDFLMRMQGNGAVGIVVAIAAYLLIFKSTHVELNAHASKCVVFVALAFSAAETIGFNIDRYSLLLNPNSDQILAICDFVYFFLCYFVLFASVLRVIVCALPRCFSRIAEVFSKQPPLLEKIDGRPCLRFCIFMLTLLIAWLPYFLLLQPGVVTQDTYDEINQATGHIALSDHHPIAYTAFLKLALHCGVLLTGNIGSGIVVCTLAQMLLLAIVLSMAISLIDYVPQYGWLLRIVCLAFLALNPLVGWYSVTLWKDVLFSAFVLLLCSGVISLVMQSDDSISAKKAIVLFIAMIGVLFLKKTGIYLVIPTVVALIIILPRIRIRILIASASVAALAFYLTVHGALIQSLGIVEGDSREALSVPLQQVARVVANDPECLNDSDSQAISTVLPLEDLASLYYPKVSDNVKNEFNTAAFNQDRMAYVKTYFKLGLSHPVEYLEAFLSGTSGYWYPETRYWSVSGSDYQYVLTSNAEYGEEVFDDISQYPESKVESPGRVQAIELVTGVKNIPIISILLSIGAWVWIYFSMFCFLPKSTKKKFAPVFVLVAMVWVTCLISPVYAETRYAYPLALMLPLVCGVVVIEFCARQQKRPENE